MINRFLKWGISLLKSNVDESVPEEQLSAYLRRGLAEFKRHLEQGAITLELPQVIEMIELVGTLERGGFTGLPSFSEWAGVTPPSPHSVRQPANGKLLHRGLIDRAVVDALAMSFRQGKPLQTSDRTMLEGLLRQIEVRRRGGLRFIGSTSNLEQWGSVVRISRLFSMVARSEGDLRYLNAAFKLNDWSYRFFSRRREIQAEIGYLCALLRAEWAFMELTG